ncbi:AKIP1 protein, partial [Psilopogon haemacephalus]|nr:AKIP1 protein [Psilopogon haemacephalus]
IALKLLHTIFSVSTFVQKYYSFMAACKHKEHEIKHICRYHGRQADKSELATEEEEVSLGLIEVMNPCSPFKTRQASEDIYIEVSPGTYSVTATSEDMVQQTHVVDVSAGQSIDLTFIL